jgi:hypothetical protein
MTAAAPGVTMRDVGSEAALLVVRATVHLPGGIRPGDVVTVDPAVPYIAEALDAETLVPLDTPRDTEPS